MFQMPSRPRFVMKNPLHLKLKDWLPGQSKLIQKLYLQGQWQIFLNIHRVFMKNKREKISPAQSRSIAYPTVGIVVGLGFYVYLGVYLSTKRVVWPFVDDWVLLEWLLGTEELSIRSLFSQINGHQHVIIKIMLFSYGRIFGESLFGFSLISLALGILGFGLILYTKLAGKFSNIFTFALFYCSAFAILATPRQLQNYFLPICAPWMLSIFFIGLYIYSGDRQSKKFWKRIKMVCLFLAPFSNGLGLVVPIYELISRTFRYLSNGKKGIDVSSTVAITAILISNVLPRISIWFDSPGSAGSFSASFTAIYTDPIDAFKFLLLALAQPFLSWHGPNIELGLALGGLELLAIVFLLRPKKGVKIRDHLDGVLKNECLMIGIIFVVIFLISRFGELGVLGSVEPRYTTGIVILIIGIVLEYLKSYRAKNAVGIIFALCAIYTWNLGFFVGNDYHEIRYQQSIQIEKCFYLGESWTEVSPECKELVTENIIGLPESEVLSLLNYIKNNEVRF
jgi:hypothetical protein